MSKHVSVELGLGLLSIGRSWGISNTPPPPAEQACKLIETAYQTGIRFFDTAPAYAQSEKILGSVLQENPEIRENCIIATKMGEFWNEESSSSYTAHHFDRLKDSIEKSMVLLGRIDIMQLHKSDIQNIASKDVEKAIQFGRSIGIHQFGASVSDMETAEKACMSGLYDYLQFPFNKTNTKLQNVFSLLAKKGMQAIINRPFAMGALSSGQSEEQRIDAFRFILAQDFKGIILSGTSSADHLKANIKTFQLAQKA
jgi:Predicted oxidoreductases (related to aryl-alcohol dehydrogenases)